MKADKVKLKLFEEICTIYSKNLQRFIYSLTRKDQFAMEEIFQNTILEAFQGLNNLRDVDKMKTWIYSIAKTEAKRYYLKNQKIIYLNDSHENVAELAGEYNLSDFTKTLENKELTKALLSYLPDDEQQIFILYYFYDLPLKEISEILHINYNTIKTIHVRGLAKLQKRLSGEKYV